MPILGKTEKKLPFLVGRCPNCQSTHVTRACILYSWQYNGVDFLENIEGARYSCQNCGHIYNAGPTGAYVPHPQALPLMLKPPMPEPERARAPDSEVVKPQPPGAQSDLVGSVRMPSTSRA